MTGKPDNLAGGGGGSALFPIANIAMAMLIISPNAERKREREREIWRHPRNCLCITYIPQYVGCKLEVLGTCEVKVGPGTNQDGSD